MLMSLGCGTLFSIDGNWKLRYPTCMYNVPRIGVPGFGGALRYVDSCPNQPMHGMAFCVDHCHIAEGEGIQCALREFLHHCGVKKIGRYIFLIIILRS